MDVNDVKKTTAKGQATQSQSAVRKSLRPSNSLNSAQVLQQSQEIVTLSLSNSNTESLKETKVRSGANQLISQMNLSSQAAGEIEDLVKSLDGIVQQATQSELPERRLAALEKEAKELVGKINEVAQTTSASTSTIKVDDDVRAEIEQRIGKTLDAILPDNPDELIGISEISLSPKDSIINTIANVTAARERIEGVRRTIDQTRGAVGAIVAALDVAAQNSAASEASIRDVDQAVELASQARIGIFEDPGAALESVGDLDSRSLGLLK
ncbi:MAG: hypothetical protein KDD42_08095 [Bdellovibrionales bacterium]|nr:hypothetical protein [Bdellovibrionales bacterium]